MKKMNKKGFTLIELLAVIIILGVLLLIAVPSVSKYIQQSRMKTYKNNLSNFVSAVTNEVNAMDYDSKYTFNSTEILVVPFNVIELEKGNNEKSPFSYYDQDYSFVLVTRKYNVTGEGDDAVYTPVGYNYYVQALDESGYGTKLVLVDNANIEALDANADSLVKIVKKEGEEPTLTIPESVKTTSKLPSSVDTAVVLQK